MKHFSFLIGIALLVQACGDTTGTGSKPAEVGAVNLDGLQLTEMPGGYQKAIRYDDKGQVSEEGMLLNGKRNGTWIVYHTDKPLPASVANFMDDQYSGPYLQFAPSGQVELIANYKANQLDGHFVKLKNNRKTEEGNYADGQFQGTYTRYYPGKEVVQQVVTYEKGQLDGPARYFNESGELIMEYEYSKGEKISGGIVENKPAAGGE